MTLDKIKQMRFDINKVLQRHQELFKLLNWYLAQNIMFRIKIKKLKKKLKKTRLELNEIKKNDFIKR